MKYAFIFGRVAITVRYWEQRGKDIEAGARIDVRRVEQVIGSNHRPGAAGCCLLPISDGGIWRADLFKVINEAGSKRRDHHHPHFEKGDVGKRVFDPAMTSDPVGWTERKLRDLRTLLIESHAGDLADSVDYSEFASALPVIRIAIDACLNKIVALPIACRPAQDLG